MATMTARYPGRCAQTGREFRPGARIDYDKRTKRAILLDDGTPPKFEDPATGRYLSHIIRTSSGAELYRNKRGRCEDAPCCGCCNV